MSGKLRCTSCIALAKVITFTSKMANWRQVDWWYSGHDQGPAMSAASYGQEIYNNYFLVLGLPLCGIGFQL
jgi:hypothetical protein